MNIPGVLVYLAGPPEAQEAALAALQTVGIMSNRSDYQLGQIEAWFSDGSENPPASFCDESAARAAAAVEGTGFTVDRAVLWGGGPFRATSKVIVDTETGNIEGIFDTEMYSPLEIEEKVKRTAEQLGIPVSRLEIQDPPTFQPPSA
jgi:hypothetical protein